MMKKMISLALALVLCLGLAVPAMAVDTSGLDTNGAKAFYDTLSAYSDAVIHADLLDMNGDKSPELVVVSSPWPDGNGFNYNVATVDIWQLKSGQAAKTVSVECDAGTVVGMNYISVDGEVCLCASASSGRPGFHGIWETFVFAERWEFLSACWYDEPAGESENIADEINSVDFSRATNGGSGGAISREEYKAYIQKYRSASSVGDGFLSAGGQSWYLGEENAPSYQDVLNNLLIKASATSAPAAGTYGPYTITGTAYDGSVYAVFFDMAKVEKKTVQIRNKLIHAFGDPDEITPYHTENVVLVTLKPGSNISMSLGNVWGPFSIMQMELDGNDQFTIVEQEFFMREADEGLLKDDLKTGGSMLDEIDGVKYIVVYEDMYNAAAASGFTDVKSDAYYADAVQWAVDKEITAGTGANKFSPEQTCTVGQILTFLWRANGSPKQTGGNPFSDVSSSDYYYDAALWAHGKGLVSGGQLNPGAACTRAMTVTYLWKLAGSPTVSHGDQYAPYSMVWDDYDYDLHIEFEAAMLKKGIVTTCQDGGVDPWEGEYVPDEIEDQEYTIIVVRPNSKMTIRGGSPDKQIGSDTVSGISDVSIDESGTLHYEISWDTPDYVSSRHISESACIIDGPYNEFYDDYERYLVIPNTAAYSKIIPSAASSGAFADVPSTSDYAQAVAWAVENEITGGTGSGQFSPNSTCTRGQIVTFLYRAMGQ